MLSVWLALVFVVGACVGSWLNVAAQRLPYEKSLLWPGWRCGRCLGPIRALDALPLLGYWLRRGRCRACGKRFAFRYFALELLTGLGFAGMFYLVAVANVHDLPALEGEAAGLARGRVPWNGLLVFAHHATLFCFLLVASVIDLDHFEIPLPVTTTGTAVGLVLATLAPWPWPNPAALAAGLAERPWGGILAQARPVAGLYPWPVWGPLPDALPAGSWQLGLATGVAGMLTGMIVLRMVRFLFSTGMGVEAMGMGDVDLMMMAGAFLGWQPVAVAFLVGVFPALVFAVLHKAAQAVAAPRRLVVELGELQPDGTPLFKADGQALAEGAFNEGLAALLAQGGKTGVRIDTLPLDLSVDKQILTLGEAAEKAGVGRAVLVEKGEPPSLLKDFFSPLGRLFGRQPRFSLEARADLHEGKPVLLVGGRRVGVEDMKAAFAELAGQGAQGELTIDPAPLRDRVGRAVARVHEAASRAGLDDVRLLDRGIPFGPGLSAGVMLTLLGWSLVGPGLQIVFFDPVLIGSLFAAAGVFLFVAALLLRLMRRARGAA